MAENLTVQDIFRAIARSWPLLLAVVVVCVAVSLGAYALFPQRYTASAQHTVEPIAILSTGSTFNTVNMQTESVVATSDSVLERAAKAAPSASVATLRDVTTVTIPRSSQVLTITVTTASAENSAQWANAVATAYGQQRRANAEAVRTQIRTDLTKAIAQLRLLYDSQPAQSSEREVTQLQIQALLDQQAQLAATPLYPGSLVTVAAPPDSPDRPSLLIFLAGGLLIGVLAGALVALLRSRARSTAEPQPKTPDGQPDSKAQLTAPTWSDAKT